MELYDLLLCFGDYWFSSSCCSKKHANGTESVSIKIEDQKMKLVAGL